MIEKVFIISFLVFAIWYTMKPGEIFDWLANWLEKWLPKKMHDPVFGCPVCMCFWYGTALYWVIPWVEIGINSPASLKQWLVVVVAAMGFNAVCSHLFPDEIIKVNIAKPDGSFVITQDEEGK